MKRHLKRAVIGFFLIWLSTVILTSVYYRVTFWDGAELVYAKTSTAMGMNIGHVEKVRVVDGLGRDVIRDGDPQSMTYAQLLLKFAGKDPVNLALEDDKRGEARSIAMRVAYTDAISVSVHPVGTHCSTIRPRHWMYYSGRTFGHGEMSFPVARMVREYNIAVALLPKFQEHNAFRNALPNRHISDYRELDCLTLQSGRRGEGYTSNGTTYAVEQGLIHAPVDYETLRRRVTADLGLTEEEYAAEKEKYYAANDIYVSTAAGDLEALKAYQGDLKRRNVVGQTLLEIAGGFSSPDHPYHAVYIYLLREAGDADDLLSVALKYGVDYLRRYNIPFDEKDLEARIEKYYQIRVERALGQKARY